ncbi:MULTISPECIES: hypothetical protein [unclassified Pseudoalteromonas]|uniref:hypothetical protein n=1 Tax=unclassified Pseudoalteromonas TaxID=194690 RepID=UPI0020985429|nr:hypothetical protein [Pseudoalteromonas sp. XMcav2-N]MCO7187132.1 hypothetical protein [Pseudoalteromonas sp. XMcav2-N]
MLSLLRTLHYRAWLTVTLIVVLTGCNSTPANKNAILLAQNGHYEQAKTTIETTYSATGKNKLLRYLELGTLYHLEQQYELSNDNLDTAKAIIEEQYTVSVSEQALALLSGPTYTTFSGKAFHRPMINVFKALNYNALANQHPTQRQYYLDAALVEMRQLDTYLSTLTDETGGYDGKPSGDGLTDSVMRILQPLLAPNDLLKNIDYKDDAFAHYISGILYESSNELDAARIQYQRAATAFEQGFAKQYDLNSTVTQQAYSDLARVMRKAGGYGNELSALEEKWGHSISNTKHAGPRLTVVQNAGIGPQRKEFNLLLKADHNAKALVVTPILWGTPAERRAQMWWFQMLYADTSLFDMMQNYATGDLGDVAMGALTKRLPLGDSLWKSAKTAGLIDALEHGSRIAVTYLEPFEQKIEKTELWLDGKKVTELDNYHSVSLLTLQSALKNANTEMQIALTREVVKAMTAHKAIQSTGLQAFDGFAKLATSVVNAVTAGADLRQWQSLPSHIKLAQVPVTQGTVNITLKTKLRSGKIIEQSDTIEINENMTLWHTRTFIESAKSAAPSTLFTME